MSIYTEIYKPFNELALKETNVDWNTFSSTGIYPDSALLLVETVKREEVNTILEIGSGASTVYLTAICQKLGKVFISLEESSMYLEKTKELLRQNNLPTEHVLLAEDFDFSSMNLPDFLFLDSVGKYRTTFLKKMENEKWHPKDIKIFMVDDTENPKYYVPINEWLGKHNRYNTQNINIVQRADRSQLVNFLDEKFHIYAWIWSWRPDQKFW